MSKPNCRLRRCLWDAIGIPLVYGAVVLIAVVCNHLLDMLV